MTRVSIKTAGFRLFRDFLNQKMQRRPGIQVAEFRTKPGLHIRGFGPELEALVTFYRSPQIRDESKIKAAAWWYADAKRPGMRSHAKRGNKVDEVKGKNRLRREPSYGI